MLQNKILNYIMLYYDKIDYFIFIILSWGFLKLYCILLCYVLSYDIHQPTQSTNLDLGATTWSWPERLEGTSASSPKCKRPSRYLP